MLSGATPLRKEKGFTWEGKRKLRDQHSMEGGQKSGEDLAIDSATRFPGRNANLNSKLTNNVYKKGGS